MAGKTMIPPHPCARCGRKMTLPSELNQETYTQTCDACAFKPAFVEAIQTIDQAKIWSYPAPSPTERLRPIKIGYTTCANCAGKGCDECLTIYNAHPVRVWIKEREERIKRAAQSVYEKELKREGILELAKKDCAPPARLQRALGPMMIKYERIVSLWRSLVTSRLKPLAMSRR